MASLEFEIRERAKEVAEEIWAALEADENDLVRQVRLIIERALARERKDVEKGNG